MPGPLGYLIGHFLIFGVLLLHPFFCNFPIVTLVAFFIPLLRCLPFSATVLPFLVPLLANLAFYYQTFI